MSKMVFLLLSPIAALIALLALPLAAAQVPPEVILVGTVHTYHFKPESHYALEDLRQELEALHPDVICGEITPEAYQAHLEGYFPPEASYLAELAPSLNSRFVPVDWRMARAWQRRAEHMEPPENARLIEANGTEIQARIEAYRGPSLFDLMHSEGIFKLVDRQFEDVAGENTLSDLAMGAWHERNRRIVENSLEAAGTARRIVIVFGASHIPQLRRQLAAQGITAKVAERRFTPGGLGTVPPNVLNRWRKNLANLRGILDGSVKAGRNALEEVKDSHRIKDLEEALALYGTPASQASR